MGKKKAPPIPIFGCNVTYSCKRQFRSMLALNVHIARKHPLEAVAIRRRKKLLARAARLDPAAHGDLKTLQASRKEVFICSLPLAGGSLPSIGDRFVGGRVFSANPILAAERIDAGTHRLATPKEIAQWRFEGQERLRQTTAAEHQRHLREHFLRQNAPRPCPSPGMLPNGAPVSLPTVWKHTPVDSAPRRIGIQWSCLRHQAHRWRWMAWLCIKLLGE